MAETPRNEQAKEGADLVGAARDRGLEHLEGAKAQLAEGAERAADAVERTADELDGEGDSGLSGFGRSMANVMRQLAGGLRERDVEAFAHELGALARRNPGVFLAGSVALGFGMARFFKARAPQSSTGADYGRQDDADYGRQADGAWQRSEDGLAAARGEFDADESLDLSAGSSKEKDSGQASATAREDDRSQSKSRQSGKQKAKPQRASSGSQQAGPGSPASSNERPQPETSPTPGSSGTSDSPFTGGTGGGSIRGGKS
jgi:hypothetical protein